MQLRLPLLYLLFALTFSTTVSYGQTHFMPDSSYGINGIAAPDTYSPSVWLHHMLGSTIQADGKILMAGTGNFQNNIEVVRLNVDGSLDTFFNHKGFALYNGNGSGPWKFIGIRVNSTGKILIGYYSMSAGNTRFSVRCLLPDGSVDASFGAGGKAEIGPSISGNEIFLNWMELQPDDKILLAGAGNDAFYTQKYLLARMKPNGSLDSTFGVNGLVKCPFLLTENRHMTINTFRLQADGKIIAAGTIPPGAAGNPDTLVLFRYLATGTLDITYGTGGIAKYQDRLQPGTIRIDSNSDAYIIGMRGLIAAPDTFYIKKFSSNGHVVDTFGVDGTVTVGVAMNVRNEHEQLTNWGKFELLKGGKMIVAGTSDSSSASAFRVCRLMGDGQMDTSFAPMGTITVPRTTRDYCSDMQLQADGKIVLTGFYRTGNGTFDTARVLAMRFWDHVIPPVAGGIPVAPITNNSFIYPNPTSDGKFWLSYHNAGSDRDAAYKIVNAVGTTVAQGSLHMQAGTGNAQVDAGTQLPAGIYYLQITGGSDFKVVITR